MYFKGDLGRSDDPFMYPPGDLEPVDVLVTESTAMAIDASYMYQQHPEEHRLKPTEFNDMYQLAILTRSADDSQLLNLRGGPWSRWMPRACASNTNWAGRHAYPNIWKRSRWIILIDEDPRDLGP